MAQYGKLVVGALAGFFAREIGAGLVKRNQTRAARPLWIALGVLSLGFGAAGSVLPLLPTTPFVLLSAYAFAKSSPRLHWWLTRRSRFGPLIKNWRLHGAIDRRAKIVAVTVMILTPLVTWMIGAPLWILGVQCLVLLGAASFVLTRPETGPSKAGPSKESTSPQ